MNRRQILKGIAITLASGTVGKITSPQSVAEAKGEDFKAFVDQNLLVHYPVIPGRPICGANVANQRTSGIARNITCVKCLKLILGAGMRATLTSDGKIIHDIPNAEFSSMEEAIACIHRLSAVQGELVGWWMPNMIIGTACADDFKSAIKLHRS